jgi:hypothetical protein
MSLPENSELDRAINEFVDINYSLTMTREQRKFEGGVLAQVIANKINELSPEERQKWIITLLGYLAEATNLAIKKGIEVETMMLQKKIEGERRNLYLDP